MEQPKSLRYGLSWSLRTQPTSWQRWLEAGALAEDLGELICHLPLDTALPRSVTQLCLPLPGFLLSLQSLGTQTDF